MTVTQKVTTADELAALASDGCRYELTNGSLRALSPAGGRHGRLASRLGWLLSNHVHAARCGIVLAAETGFRLTVDPDTVLAPDVAYVERSRYEAVENEITFLPFAPDLAIEVLSPNDRFSRVESKAFTWLDAGCRLVLLVDPESETVHAYHTRKQIQVFERDEIVDCNDGVPGWSLIVEEVFRRD